MTAGFAQWSYPTEIQPTTPVFTITPENGFLPLSDPILLPERFHELTQLLDDMSVKLPDGSPGLLATGEFGSRVEKLPLYDCSDIEDQHLLMALFRDYTFATSAYLLEPCDILNRQKGHYGQGRSVLPKNLAVPLKVISDKIAAKPFMEYAQSYALYNYKRLDKDKPLEYDNIELIRKVLLLIVFWNGGRTWICNDSCCHGSPYSSIRKSGYRSIAKCK